MTDSTSDRADPEFFQSMDRQLTGWDEPVARLRRVLEKDELALFCQPVIALRGAERYPFAEALVRLREEENALLPPGDFLPIYEHYEMMPQLDRWVVHQLLRRLKQGSRLRRFSANLSGQSLEDPGFASYVAAEVAASGLPGNVLIFEIDEADTLARLGAAARFVQEVRPCGASILIDGFGQRSVSFDAIKILKPDYVKVDGSIVRKILTSSGAETKLRTVLRVGEVTGMAVVAECVEHQDLLLRLKSLGVGYAQGFGIYEPHPIDSLAGL